MVLQLLGNYSFVSQDCPPLYLLQNERCVYTLIDTYFPKFSPYCPATERQGDLNKKIMHECQANAQKFNIILQCRNSHPNWWARWDHLATEIQRTGEVWVGQGELSTGPNLSVPEVWFTGNCMIWMNRFRLSLWRCTHSRKLEPTSLAWPNQQRIWTVKTPGVL